MMEGPNVGSNEEQFFQTDRGLERQRVRDAKRKQGAKMGMPLTCPSKVLAIELDLELAHTKPDEGPIVYVAESGFICRCLNLKTNKTLQTFKGHKGPVTCVLVLLGQQTIVTGSWDKSIRQWSTTSGECLRQVANAHLDFVKCLCAPGTTGISTQQDILRTETGSSTTTVFSGSSDSTIRAWNFATGDCLRKYEGHRRGVEALLLSSDGRRLFTCGSDPEIHMFDVASAQSLRVLEGHRTSVYGLSLSFEGDDEELWSASADQTVKRWNLSTGLAESSFPHPDWVKCFTAFGPYLVTGSRDEKVRVWDLATEKCVHVFEGHFDEVSALLVVGKTLYSGSYDCTIRRWDLSEVGKGVAAKPQSAAPARPPMMTIQKTPKELKSVLISAEEEAELAELMGED